MTGPLARMMMCSGCGHITTDTRAVTCCKGYCQDRTGNSCNLVAMPGLRAASLLDWQHIR